MLMSCHIILPQFHLLCNTNSKIIYFFFFYKIKNLKVLYATNEINIVIITLIQLIIIQ